MRVSRRAGSSFHSFSVGTVGVFSHILCFYCSARRLIFWSNSANVPLLDKTDVV